MSDTYIEDSRIKVAPPYNYTHAFLFFFIFTELIEIARNAKNASDRDARLGRVSLFDPPVPAFFLPRVIYTSVIISI